MLKLQLRFQQLNNRLSFWRKKFQDKNEEIYNEIIDDISDKLLKLRVEIKKEAFFVQKTFMKDGVFNKKDYLFQMDIIIFQILNKLDNDNVSYDILDSEETMKNKLLILREKQRQMKIGEIWQEMIGNYDGFENLKKGHASGLDVLSMKRKLAIEIKNRTNTDNSSAKKTNFSKLSNFKKNNPDFTCIYATINADTEKKTLEGMSNTFLNNGYEIEHWVGVKFLKLIFGEDYEEVIQFIKFTINKYSY